MLIPKYWAQVRLRHKSAAGEKPRRQITLHRFGWSDHSQEQAEQHAQQRVQEAMQDVLNGKVEQHNIRRHEAKVAYNGADGLPILEQTVAQHGDCVITRNSYGALCLNVSDVMFIDIDFVSKNIGCGPFFIGFGIAGISSLLLLPFYIGLLFVNLMCSLIIGIIGGIFAYCMAVFFNRSNKSIQRGLASVEAFAQQHSGWTFDIYRTSAGFRLLFLDRPVDPRDENLWQQLAMLNPDPVYARMCRLQNCFRARLTPKPWRVGISQRIEPDAADWDISQENKPYRLAWIADYETASQDYATCYFIKQYGQGPIHPKAQQVRTLHQQWCKTDSTLPLA